MVTPASSPSFDRCRQGDARVLLVLAGEDGALRKLGTQRPTTPRKRRDGSPAFVSRSRYLAARTVRYLGDPVAFVVAETLEQAKDAAEAITVEYEALPASPPPRMRSGPAPSRCGKAARTTKPSPTPRRSRRRRQDVRHR